MALCCATWAPGWMSHFTYECVTTRTSVSWLVLLRHVLFVCDMPHGGFLSGMTFSYVKWVIHMWPDSITHVTWLIHMWHNWFVRDFSNSYGTRLICTYVTQLIHIWQRPDWGVYRKRGRQVCIASTWLLVNSYVTWLIHRWHNSCIYDVTHSYVLCLISYVTWLMTSLQGGKDP